MTDTQLRNFVLLFSSVWAKDVFYLSPSQIVKRIWDYYSVKVTHDTVLHVYFSNGIEYNWESQEWIKVTK